MNVKKNHSSVKLCVLSWTMVQRECGAVFLHSWLYTVGGFVLIHK